MKAPKSSKKTILATTVATALRHEQTSPNVKQWTPACSPALCEPTMTVTEADYKNHTFMNRRLWRTRWCSKYPLDWPKRTGATPIVPKLGSAHKVQADDRQSIALILRLVLATIDFEVAPKVTLKVLASVYDLRGDFKFPQSTHARETTALAQKLDRQTDAGRDARTHTRTPARPWDFI